MKTLSAFGLAVALAFAPVAASAKNHHHHHKHGMMKQGMKKDAKGSGNAQPAGEGSSAAEQQNK